MEALEKEMVTKDGNVVLGKLIEEGKRTVRDAPYEKRALMRRVIRLTFSKLI